MTFEKRSIVSSARTVSVLTFLSRVLGVIRDSVIVKTLGASVFSDIFNMAFEISNLARRVLGEGALSAFIVPVYHQEEKLGGAARAFRFFNRAVTVMFVIGLALTVAGIVFAKPLFLVFGGLKYALAGSADGADYVALGVKMTRIMLPYVLILTLVALFMGVCHAHRRFFTPTLGSSGINVTIIAAALLIANADKAHFAVCLAWAVVAGVALRLAIMWPTLHGLGWRLAPEWQWRDPAMKSLFGKMGAAVFAAGLAQLNISINLTLANWCGTGSVTYLRYSSRLIEFPLALLAVPVGTAIIPLISRNYVHGNFDEARSVARFGMRLTMVLTFPAMAGIWVLGGPALALIFQRGEWTPTDTDKTAVALSMYALGLLPMALARLLIPLYYGKGDVRTPVKAAACALVFNIAANLIAIQTPLSYAGIALGGSVAALVNAWLLWRWLRRDLGTLWDATVGRTALRCGVASLAMAAVCGGALAGWESLRPATHFVARAIQVGAISGLGVIVYFAAALALRVEDLGDAVGVLRRKRPAGAAPSNADVPPAPME